MMSSSFSLRCSKSAAKCPWPTLIIRVAQSGEVLVPFSPLLAEETTEKTRGAGFSDFPLSGNIP